MKDISIESTLHIRNAKSSDISKIVKLTSKAYPGMPAYTSDMIRGQINNFPEGQFVAVYDKEIVGYCATFIISGDLALKKHSWKEITGSGFAARHDENGDYLYGMEVCVDKEFRGLRIGQRLYNERKNLCTERKLKGIVFGGRMPGYTKI